VTPRGTRPGSFVPGPPRDADRYEEPDLIRQIRGCLATGEPLDLLAEASSLVAAVDPRRENPFDRAKGERLKGPSLDELTLTFEEIEGPETAALLAAVAQLAPDELVRARARRALRIRPEPLPGWLSRLGDSEVYSAVAMVDALGDGDDIMLGVRLHDRQELSVAVYIDHNLGTVVKDAFVVPGPLAALVDLMRTDLDVRDVEWRDIELAEARTKIVEAIALADMTYPPMESDSWPACQPIVEWVARLLPVGGTGYIREEWSKAAERKLTKRFFSSPEGSALDDRDHRQLFESLLWFGTGYGPGDPMRWSPVNVEMLLSDWIPRKIVADAEFLSKAPDLLRAFVRFCHAERGIRIGLTSETLESIDRWEPEYQRVIRSPRLQGPEALLAAMGVLDPDQPWDDDEDYDEGLYEDEFDYEFVVRQLLEEAVGGAKALDSLDADPLPDEEFAWNQVADDIRERVGEVLSMCDRCCDDLLDAEYRTSCRRLLARVATGNPDFFRRRGRSDTAAAALCYVVGKANRLFSASRGGMRIKDLMEAFGVTQSSISQRADTLLKAAGIPVDPYGDLDLGSPALLVSTRRRYIIEVREHLAQESRLT
jgi:hypothetical protein